MSQEIVGLLYTFDLTDETTITATYKFETAEDAQLFLAMLYLEKERGHKMILHMEKESGDT